jgi:hypothetical protein
MGNEKKADGMMANKRVNRVLFTMVNIETKFAGLDD